MIDVSSIINDPDFNVSFTRIQVSGAFDNTGVWVTTEGAVENMNGIILPYKEDKLAPLPEGERQQGAIRIWSLSQLNMGEDNETTQSDIIGYLDGFYRIALIRFYLQVQIWYAVATRYQRAP